MIFVWLVVVEGCVRRWSMGKFSYVNYVAVGKPGVMWMRYFGFSSASFNADCFTCQSFVVNDVAIKIIVCL